MENQEKIYTQFKEAASKVESKDFAGMEKVWENLENKLDQKALKKETKTWKKVAVAASILLVGTIGFQFLNSDKEVILPKETIVSTTEKELDSVENTAVVDAIPSNPLIKENAPKLVQEAISGSQNVVVHEAVQAPIADESAKPIIVYENKNSETEEKDGYFVSRKFDAIGVKHYNKEIVAEETESKKIQQKAPPLVVLDGKATKSETILNRDDIETLTYLDDPLYIINGVEYTEKELFGPNPTSPYYPINKQNIISTTVLQGESATSLYGEKGKKGVLIIVTKDKKPAKQ